MASQQMASQQPPMEADGFTTSSSPRSKSTSGLRLFPRVLAGPSRDDLSHLVMSQRKGLSNEIGANNCFLNVVIQSLWHIRSFRTIITTGEHAVHHRPDLHAKAQANAKTTTTAQDADASSRMQSFDRATMTFAKTPCLLCELERIFVFYQYGEDPVLDVDRVRIALSTLFELGEMNDATETLETILDALHVDTFNQMIALRQEGDLLSNSKAKTLDVANSIVCEPRCVAHLLFQMNLMDLQICNNLQCGATTEPIMNTDFLYRVYAQEILRHSDQKSLEEVLFLEAQGKCSEADAKTSDGAGLLSKKCELCGTGTMNPSRWSLTLPMVFAVSVIWSSPCVNKEDVRKWMQLLSSQRRQEDKTTINLSKIFQTEHGHHQQLGTAPSGTSDNTAGEDDAEYVFRGLVCYYGRHYVGFFASRSDENGSYKERWFLFDDTRVKRVGDWEDVRFRIERGGYQPTLLFYERKNINHRELEEMALEIHNWWKETSEKYMQLHQAKLRATDELKEEQEEEDVRRVDESMDDESFEQLQHADVTWQLPLAPTPASSSLNIYDDLHHYHKTAEETLSRLNGILRRANSSQQAPSSMASVLSGSMRRMSFRHKREYSCHSQDALQAVDVNRDAIFLDKTGSPSPKQRNSSNHQTAINPSAVKSSSPSNRGFGFVSGSDTGLGASIREIQLNVSDAKATTPKSQAPGLDESQVFEVVLNASDGGLGLELRDEMMTLMPQEQSIRPIGTRGNAAEKQFIVTGFETSVAGRKLPAEASGKIRCGDVLLAINQQSTRGQNLLQVMETLVVSENPVHLLFHRVAPWTCPRCTLHNPRVQAICAACGFEMSF